MSEIIYVDRLTRQTLAEKVYGRIFIHLLYGEGFFPRLFSFFLLPVLSRFPFFSKLYGFFQKNNSSRGKIKPFISTFGVDTTEFLQPVDSFKSFNDFFIRQLKKSARPFAEGQDVAILPADGRYLVYPNIATCDGFWVKGKKFNLATLLQDASLAKRYETGAMVLARLCPSDYHRFHFPCDAIPGVPRLINGPLYSVNPLALKRNIEILAENKRVITPLQTEAFGQILYIDIGATYVGSIYQLFNPGQTYRKGDEKGYFSFGGSSLILLFEPDRIVIDQDLLDASSRRIETRGLLGQSVGKSVNR